MSLTMLCRLMAQNHLQTKGWYYIILTHWGLNKCQPWQAAYSNALSWMKIVLYWLKFKELSSLCSNWKSVSIGVCNGMTINWLQQGWSRFTTAYCVTRKQCVTYSCRYQCVLAKRYWYCYLSLYTQDACGCSWCLKFACRYKVDCTYCISCHYQYVLV